MEQQPGPVNWAPYNPAPLPGMVRLWTWEAFAHGAEVGLLLPLAPGAVRAGADARGPADPRQPRRARPRRGGAGRARARQPPRGRAASAGARRRSSSTTPRAWAWATQPQGRDFDYFRLVFEAYRGLRLNGLTIDILPPDTADLSPYALVVIPGLARLDRRAARRARRLRRPSRSSARAAGRRPRDMRDPRRHAPRPARARDPRRPRRDRCAPPAPVPLAGGGAFHIWREITDGASRGRRAHRRRRRPRCAAPAACATSAAGPTAPRCAACSAPRPARPASPRSTCPTACAAPRRRREVFWFNYAAEPVALAEIAGDPDLPATLGPADLHRRVKG